MKRILFYFLAAVSFSACSKKGVDVSSPSAPSPAPSPAVSMKIKTQTIGTTVRTFTYDAQGRALKVDYGNGSKKEYEYAPGLVTRKYFNTSGIYQYSQVEELNTDGNSIRSTKVNQAGSEILYTYNPDKTLAKQIIKSTNSTFVFDYFWSNGNMDSVRYSSQAGTWYYTYVKTYFTDKPNVLSNAAFGEEYWGKSSNNLLKASIMYNPDGSTGVTETYSYEFDNHGRVIKQTLNESGNTSVTINTYN